jgi:hypothetical protein
VIVEAIRAVIWIEVGTVKPQSRPECKTNSSTDEVRTDTGC